jgi:predicted secreted protein
MTTGSKEMVMAMRSHGDAAGWRIDRAVPGPGALRPSFTGRVINDGAGLITLDAPESVSHGRPLSLSVRVNWSLVVAKAIAHLYVIADGQRDPVLARVALLPDVVPPYVSVTACLEHSTDISAVVECGDGTLLQVRRRVRVEPAGRNDEAPCINQERYCPLRALAARMQGD